MSHPPDPSAIFRQQSGNTVASSSNMTANKPSWMTFQRGGSSDSNDSTSPACASPPDGKFPSKYLLQQSTTTATAAVATTSTGSVATCQPASVTQPSPPETPYHHDDDEKLATTTPSRRSKRQRTPSAKKKAFIETERIFSSRKKHRTSPDNDSEKDNDSRGSGNSGFNTSSGGKENHLGKSASFVVKQKPSASVQYTVPITTTFNNSKEQVCQRENPRAEKPTAQPVSAPPSTSTNDFVAACKASFTSPFMPTTKHNCSSNTLNTQVQTTLQTQLETMSNTNNVREAPSPRPELLTDSMVTTPQASDDEDNNNLGLAVLPETSNGYFRESPPPPKQQATPAPPKRTRARTPFAKKASNADEEDNHDDNNDEPTSTKMEVPQNMTTDSRIPIATSSQQGQNDHLQLTTSVATKAPSDRTFKPNSQEPSSMTSIPKLPMSRPTPPSTSALLLRKQMSGSSQATYSSQSLPPSSSKTTTSSSLTPSTSSLSVFKEHPKSTPSSSAPVNTGSSLNATKKRPTSSFVLPPLPTAKKIVSTKKTVMMVSQPNAEKKLPTSLSRPPMAPSSTSNVSYKHASSAEQPNMATMTLSTPQKQRTMASSSPSSVYSSTPLRRSTRKASLMSASKIKKQMSATKSKSIASMALEDPLDPMRVAAATSSTETRTDATCSSSGQSKIAGMETNTKMEASHLNKPPGMKQELNVGSAKATPSRRSSRRNSMPSLDVPTDSNSAEESPMVLETKAMKETSSDAKSSNKKRTNRRASLSLLDSQLQSIVEKTEVQTPSSIVLDDGNDRPRKRTSRRASTSAVLTKPSNNTLEAAPPSHTRKFESSLVAGPKPPLPQHRSSRRASLSTSTPTTTSNSVLESTPPPSATRRSNRRSSLSSAKRPTVLQMEEPNPVFDSKEEKGAPVPTCAVAAKEKRSELTIDVPKPAPEKPPPVEKKMSTDVVSSNKNTPSKPRAAEKSYYAATLSSARKVVPNNKSLATTTAEFTPRRSRRLSMVGSSSKSISSTSSKTSVYGNRRLLSSQDQNSSKKRCLGNEKDKSTINPFGLATLAEEPKPIVKMEAWMIAKHAMQLFSNGSISDQVRVKIVMRLLDSFISKSVISVSHPLSPFSVLAVCVCQNIRLLRLE